MGFLDNVLTGLGDDAAGGLGDLLDRILAAYDEASPLADGWRERVDLHRLHMLAVHAFLFGGGYLGDVMSIVDRYV